jgi:hypothetical protein
MKYTLIALALVIVAAAAWFFVSPLFIDETVDEGFDFIATDGHVDMDVVMGMSDEKRVEMRDEIMRAATAAPDREHMEAMPAAGPTVVATGQFIDADAVHKGSGTATLYTLPDGRNVVRFEDFRTTNGPALVVYLAKHPNPGAAADVIDSGFLNLGELKGNVGNQNYEIPAGTDISEYGSVVIWCELFDVLFSPAALVSS